VAQLQRSLSERPLVSTPGACPCCNSNASRVVLKECEDLLHGTGGRWSLIECRNCGLIRTDPMPADDQIAALYPSAYGPHHRGKKLTGVRGVGAILRRIAISPYQLRFGAPGIACHPFGAGRFLDVGCGAGTLLRKMVDAGWVGTGLDISDSALAEARASVPEASFFAGTVESAALTGPYELITMQHVLEHVPRPMDCLRRCFDLLSPGGILLIALPNFQSAEARLLGRHWVGLDVPRHLLHFREPVIMNLLQSCGYEVARRRPQMFASSISESLLLLLPANVRGKVIRSPLARALYLSLVFPACISYFLGNRGAVEIHARKPV
jgi:2-polyprenyl-3-methyl-5-hydroxy-6-metoxy-1,4-benzoquinol methylase